MPASTRTIQCKELKLSVDEETATIASIMSRGHPLMVGRHAYVAVEDRTTRGFHFRPEDGVSAGRSRPRKRAPISTPS